MTLEEVKKELDEVLVSIDKELDKYLCNNEKIPMNYDSKATQKVSSKLNAILRKERILTQSQAIERYNNVDLLHEKMCDIYDLVDYINNFGDVIYIIDKQTVSAYLNINVATYEFLRLDCTVDENIRMEFQNMEEMLISSIQQGSETKIRDNNATQRRLSLKGEYGGNGIDMSNKHASKIVIDGIIDENGLRKKLENQYNFSKIIENKKG